MLDFYTCLYLVTASFLSGFIIAWISRLLTIKSIRKTIEEQEKQINLLNQNCDLVTEQLENAALTSNALIKQNKEQALEIEQLTSENEKLINKISDFSFPTEKIDAIKNKKDVNNKTDILHKINAKKYQVDFDRIGYASNINKDNLKLIVGIGTFIEQKLNALGIYTFEQIANCNKEDVAILTDAIEFFPGLMEKDKWVEQATKLADNKAKNDDD